MSNIVLDWELINGAINILITLGITCFGLGIIIAGGLGLVKLFAKLGG